MQSGCQKLVTAEMQVTSLAFTIFVHVMIGAKLHGGTCLVKLFTVSQFSLECCVHSKVMEAHSR